MQIKIYRPAFMFAAILIVFFQMSCAKDSDLLTETVLFEPIAEVNVYVIPDVFEVTTESDLSEETIEVEVSAKDGISYNDSYQASTFEGLKLDVLANDEFEKPETAVIISVTLPDRGTVEINSDNTLIYTPSSFDSYQDFFTYTVEFENIDGSTATETAEVSIQMNLPSTAREIPEPDFYVTPGGRATNDGLSENTAWSLDHAFKVARPGDVVYLKAGDYGSASRLVSINGTSSNPIKFIGYVNTPGDVNEDLTTQISSKTVTVTVGGNFNEGDTPSATAMPLLSSSRTSSDVIGIFVSGSYLHFYNIQIDGYGQGIRNQGNYNVFKNIVAWEQGDQNTASYTGYGIRNYGNNCEYHNIYIEDSGAQGMSVQGNNGIYRGIQVVGNNRGNPIDYYFLFQTSNNNSAFDIYVRRDPSLAHDGHGVTYKATGECFNNNVNRFICLNTYLETQFPGVHDNTLSNGYLGRVGNDWRYGGMRLANGSRAQTFNNIYLENCAIKLADWDETAVGVIANESTDDNVFNQVTVDGAHVAVSFYQFRENHSTAAPENNIFYNCTFYNTNYMFENSRVNVNTQFVNCVFDNIDNYSITRSSRSYDIDVSYTYSNFSNMYSGFSVPSGNANSNNYNGGSPFTNASGGNFSVKENLQNQGIATPFLSANNSLGAFQN